MEDLNNDALHRANDYTRSEAAPEPQPFEVEPIPQPSEGQPYSGAGVGYRETIFERQAQPEPTPAAERSGNDIPPIQPPYHDATHAQPPRKHKKQRRAWRTALAAVLTLALVASGCGVTAWLVNDHWSSELHQTQNDLNEQIQALQEQIIANSYAAAGNSVSGNPVSTDGAMTPGQVYAANVNSVVLITCQVQTTTIYGPATGTSSGSGFILSENGYVVTNYHVVEGASSVSVTTYSGTQYTATVVGSDSTNDVAVLKMDAEDLPAVTLGSSDDLIVGDQVVAIGNPLGELTSTMTVGYVSAKDRDVTTDNKTINMIQIDAAINSGNSGGPLFNMQGEVVGITTAKYSGSSSSGASIESIGFAIPIDDVSGMIDDLVNLGYVSGAYLGISVSDVDSAAQVYGVPSGAHVREVVDGYCAKEAGVQVGDIITELGGYTVESYTDLSRALRKFKAGDTIEITVYRSGQSLTLEVTLDEKPHVEAEEAPASQENMPQNGTYEEWYKYFFGNGNAAG